jgi:hypothetical protein
MGIFPLTIEPILSPVAPHSEGHEFLPEMDKYRGNAAQALEGCTRGWLLL